MVKIYVDERERPSKVPAYLREMGVVVIYRRLPLGDYIPAEGVIVERKRIEDLVHSVFDGRFFTQVRELTRYSGKAFLLIEGSLNRLKYVTSRAKAIEAALITAVMFSDLRVLYSNDSRHSAEILKYMAEKLQESKVRVPTPTTYRGSAKPKEAGIREWQLHVVSALPGVGPVLAERLLKKFGSIKAIASASPAELSRVEGIDENKALRIHKIFNARYES